MPARDSRPVLEVRLQTFLVRQRRCRLHSALIPAGLPSTSLCFVSAAWASGPALADYRPVSFSLVARFLSCKQRPSCAIEDTLPNGISWASPTVNHCSAHGTWDHAIDRCSNHTPLPQRPTSVACRSVSGCRNGSGQDKFLPALPRPKAGPHAIEAPANERAGLG